MRLVPAFHVMETITQHIINHVVCNTKLYPFALTMTRSTLYLCDGMQAKNTHDVYFTLPWEFFGALNFAIIVDNRPPDFNWIEKCDCTVCTF